MTGDPNTDPGWAMLALLALVVTALLGAAIWVQLRGTGL